MLEWGVIKRSSSPYASLIIFCVKKSDGFIIFCLDACQMNQMIVPTCDTFPPLDELLSRFHGMCYFSSLNFKYFYILNTFVSFMYDCRTYLFTRLPFGLNISNMAFGQELEAALKSLSA